MLKKFNPSKLFVFLLVLFTSVCYGVDEQPFIHQEQQEHNLEEKFKASPPDIHLQSTSKPTQIIFPKESPCFVINKLVFTGDKDLPYWALLPKVDDAVKGQCLGEKGINLLMTVIQNRLIDRGWVTTRVMAPEQDLSQGILHFVIVPGKIRQIKYSDHSDKRALLYTSIPMHEGELFDLRALEQGLENLQRLPTVRANMQILPGEHPGESDVVIERKQSRIWRLSAWVDDSGDKSTGRDQAGVMFALDNPSSLSDLFYVTASHDFGSGGKKKTKNYTVHYSVPFGYWQWGITGSRYDYVQTVAGRNADLRYSGKSKSVTSSLSRVLHRNATSKTTFSYDILTRETRNFIDYTEIKVQKRRTSAWRAGLYHRHYVGAATLDMGINYKRGTRWFGALPAYEEKQPGNHATALLRIITLTASANVPFNLGKEHFRYQLQYLHQKSHTPLTPQEQLSIGNRWTVRGFDGQRTLNGTRGWYIQNTLAWRTPLPEQEFYLGADYGQVGGYKGDIYPVGRHLAGGVAGLRGNITEANLNYEVFAGKPFTKPKGFKTQSVNLGFSLNWQY